MTNVSYARSREEVNEREIIGLEMASGQIIYAKTPLRIASKANLSSQSANFLLIMIVYAINRYSSYYIMKQWIGSFSLR